MKPLGNSIRTGAHQQIMQDQGLIEGKQGMTPQQINNQDNAASRKNKFISQ